MIDTSFFILIILIFLRIISFFAILPVLFPSGTPNYIKIVFSILIAIALRPFITTGALQLNNNYMLIMYFINEVMTGLLLGYATSLCFDAMRIAGSLLDMQMGLSMLNMFDPNAKSNSTFLERLFYWTALIIFLVIDGHHMLISSMVESYKYVPIGNSIIFQESIMLTINAFMQYFIIALKIAIPIVLIIILTDITLGLIARTVPQLNVMILGLPIKILVGLLCFTIALPMIVNGMISAFNHIPEMIRGILKAVPVIFIFASEEKTEEATPKKKSEARKKGQVAKSKEVNLALTLLASTLILSGLSGYFSGNLKDTLTYFMNQDFKMNLDYNSVQAILITAIWRIAIIYLPVAVPIMLIGVLANFIQTGFILTSEPLKPQLSKINPINGFKRMFSTRSMVDMLKNLALVTVVGYVGYKYMMNNYPKILNIGSIYIPTMGYEIKTLLLGIFTKITLIMVVIAIADFIYQRYMFNKDLKMTKQEIKEEYKQDEGDPQLKSKIKQRQREIATRRMMQAVPEATVVVTNPTHLAVALKYEDKGSEAPKVIAKGADLIALKIKETAKANNVPIIENKPLARSLYNEVEIDREIPPEMYQAVAEILAAIFKLNKKR